MIVIRSWLSSDEFWCVRGDHWAGPEGDRCYVVEGAGVVCPEHITEAERGRATDLPFKREWRSAAALQQAVNAGVDPPDAETLRRIASVLADGEGD